MSLLKSNVQTPMIHSAIGLSIMQKELNNMKFEVINSEGRVVFWCQQSSCIPDKQEIESVTKSGHKIRIDGKIVTKKKLNELLRGMND